METNANTCDPVSYPKTINSSSITNIKLQESLDYECECGNGKSPNMTEYSITVPYHICQHWQEDCVKGCYAGNNLCQSSCREDHPCGATDPTRVNVTSTATTTTASRTATGTAADAEDEEGEAPKTFSGFGDGEDATTTDAAEEEAAADTAAAAPAATNGAKALDFGRAYGLPVVSAGLFAIFGLVM